MPRSDRSTRTAPPRGERNQRAARYADTAILLLGVGLLLAGTAVTAGVLVRLSPDGHVGFTLLERLKHLRVVALLCGTLAVTVGLFRLRGPAPAGIACVVSLALTFGVIQRLYPNNLLLRPRALAGALLGDEVLLTDYAPRDHLHVPQHEVLRAKYPVINIHAHFRRSLHQTPEALVSLMQQCNVEHIVDLDGELGRRFKQEATRYAGPYPDRFLIFVTVWFPAGRIDWNYFRASVEELEEAKRAGAKGIKIWKNIGMHTQDEHGRLIPIDDPRIDAVWAKAGALGLPILIHVGDLATNFEPLDRYNERFEYLKADMAVAYQGPSVPKPALLLAEFEHVVERHPEVTFILAHLGNRTDDLNAAGTLLDRHPNLYMDLSARAPELGRQPVTARAFLIKYADRILFGTDGNPEAAAYRTYFRFLETADEYFEGPEWPRFRMGRWKLYGLNLPDDVLRKLYHDNAAKLLGLPLLAGQKGPR